VDQPGSLSVVWNASTGTFGSSTDSSVPSEVAGSSTVLAGQHTLDNEVQIPANSLITRTWIEITDPPVARPDSLGDAPLVLGGIGFNCSSYVAADNIVTLVASTSNYSTSVGGQLGLGVARDTLATMHRNSSTNPCWIQAEIIDRTLSSGKIIIFVEYMQLR